MGGLWQDENIYLFFLIPTATTKVDYGKSLNCFFLLQFLPYLVYLFTTLRWVPSISAMASKLKYLYFWGPLVQQYSVMPASIYNDIEIRHFLE